MQTLLTLLVTILGGGVGSAVVAWILKNLDKKNGINKAIRMILKDRIRYLCERYTAQGFVYSSDLEELVSMHECYHNVLDGNGYLDAFMSKVKALPIKADPK